MCYGCYGESILNLLWLSRRLIIFPVKTLTYISIFPNTLNYKVAKNHEISLYFSTSAIAALCQAPPITLKFKMDWFSNK